jgi:hypothetical protein
MTVRDPKTFKYAGQGQAIPLTLADNIPVVRMTLDGGITGEFRVDVGSSSTVDLHGPFVRKNGIKSHGRSIEVVSGGFGGSFKSRLGRMRELRIGPYSWKDPLVSFSGAETGALASEDYAGNIGNHILERFVVTFDYDGRKLYLEPSRRYSQHDRFSRTGVQLARIDSTVRAMQVLANSPAYRAGLREQDEVTSIDGRPALSWTAETVRKLFDDGAVGRVVKLEVVQGDKRRTLSIKLEDIL